MGEKTRGLRKEFLQTHKATVDNTVLKVIIVEDDTFLSNSICFSLNKLENIEVVETFSNGGDVLKNREALHADIALIDVELPDCDGFEVLNALKQSVTHLIVMSHSEEYVQRAYSEMAADFLKKPFDPERLQITINRIRRKLHSSSNKPPAEETPDHIYVRVMGSTKRIVLDELALVQQLENEHIRLVMDNLEEIKVKGSLESFSKASPSSAFHLVQPGFLVHQKYLPNGVQSEIVIGNYTIPLGKDINQA